MTMGLAAWSCPGAGDRFPMPGGTPGFRVLGKLALPPQAEVAPLWFLESVLPFALFPPR